MLKANPNARFSPRQPETGSRPLTIRTKDALSVKFTSEPLLTLREVAALLQVSRTSVYRLMAVRKIPFIKVGGAIRFSRGDVESYLSDGRITPII